MSQEDSAQKDRDTAVATLKASRKQATAEYDADRPADPQAEDVDQETAATDSTESTVPATDDNYTLTTTEKQAAAHLGYSDELIAKMTKVEAKVVLAASKKQRSLEGHLGNAQDKLAKAQTAADKAPADSPQVDDVKAPPIVDDTWEPETVTAFNELQDRQAVTERRLNELVTENQGLKATQEEYMSQAQGIAEQTRVQAIDTFFDDLDQKSWDMFGTGSTADLSSTSTERLARDELIEHADRLGEVYPDLSKADLMDSALRTLHKTNYDKDAARPADEQRKAREASSVAKPSGSKPPPATDDSDEGAVKRLKEMRAAYGDA